MTSSQRRRELESDIFFELGSVFCLLVALGFPGSLTKVLGESIQKLMEYGAFLLEIAMILMASGSTWQDVELLHLDRHYTAIYIFVFSCFGISMLVTYDRSEQFITCFRLVVTMLFAIWLQERYRLDNLLELICLAQGILVLVTLLFIVRHPEYAFSDAEGESHALVGIYNTKNACATELDLGIAMTVLQLQMRWKRGQTVLRWWALLAVQLILLISCKATSAFITALLIMLPLFVLRRVRLPLGLIYITVNIVFLFSMLSLMPVFENMLVAMGKDATLTGRIPLWRRIIEVMTETHTMTGFGYGMFWRDPSALLKIHTGFSMRQDPFMASLTTGAHNVIFEMWLNSGLIGIAVFFFMLLNAFRNTGEMPEDEYQFCAVVMTVLTINGLTERCLGGNYDYRVLASFLAVAMGCRTTGAPRRLRLRPATNRTEK